MVFLKILSAKAAGPERRRRVRNAHLHIGKGGLAFALKPGDWHVPMVTENSAFPLAIHRDWLLCQVKHWDTKPSSEGGL